MPLELGSVPETLRVILVRGADFVSTLRRKDGSPWPVGSQIILEFQRAGAPSYEWAAATNGALAVWDVDQQDVDAVIAGRVRGVKLWYVEGGLRLLWAQGDIDVRGA
jgi:hypothetical protein